MSLADVVKAVKDKTGVREAVDACVASMRASEIDQALVRNIPFYVSMFIRAPIELAPLTTILFESNPMYGEVYVAFYRALWDQTYYSVRDSQPFASASFEWGSAPTIRAQRERFKTLKRPTNAFEAGGMPGFDADRLSRLWAWFPDPTEFRLATIFFSEEMLVSVDNLKSPLRMCRDTSCRYGKFLCYCAAQSSERLRHELLKDFSLKDAQEVVTDLVWEVLPRAIAMGWLEWLHALRHASKFMDRSLSTTENTAARVNAMIEKYKTFEGTVRADFFIESDTTPLFISNVKPPVIDPKDRNAFKKIPVKEKSELLQLWDAILKMELARGGGFAQFDVFDAVYGPAFGGLADIAKAAAEYSPDLHVLANAAGASAHRLDALARAAESVSADDDSLGYSSSSSSSSESIYSP